MMCKNLSVRNHNSAYEKPRKGMSMQLCGVVCLVCLGTSHGSLVTSRAAMAHARTARSARPAVSLLAISCVLTEASSTATPFTESWFEKTLDIRQENAGALESFRAAAEKVVRIRRLPRQKDEGDTDSRYACAGSSAALPDDVA